ncbi:glycosyl transferase [Desulfosarcina ovata subsp. sediminis]|uniref:Glycosyl transferase n=1 Tax=Desulfosarcina ovata subsp. sediminis TaxID=885957 RepID=A0A5K7ZQF8_9BACT|nr:glycosyltransferase family 2 protein [Desulfosarcina ovata]BBO79503.1 glycosyl transferase [Desulfosarcina ovata subsp. sediminis]
MMKIEASIIIPAYNEMHSIGAIIAEIKRLHPDFEILIINDGSTDDTARVANDAGAVVYSHPYNIGNGAAVKTGIRNAKGDILVFMDADGQHQPGDISRMLEYFPDYDMVVGERKKGGQASIDRAIGNRVYNWLASYVTKFPVKDLTSGFRAIKAEIARSYIYLLPNTYSYPTTITLGVLRDGQSVRYMAISALKRRSGKSRIRLFSDGVRFLMIIIKICTLYSPLRVFLPVSCLMFSLGLMRYFYSYMTEGRFTNMSALLFISSVIIFMMGLVSEQICQMRFERRVSDRRVKKYNNKNCLSDN